MTIPPPPGPGDTSGGRPDDDIDAEFARMMQGLDMPEASHETEGPSDERELTVDDVLSAPAAADASDAPPPVAVVATSVASAKALAAALRLAREAMDDAPSGTSPLRVHDTDGGAIVVVALPEAEAHTTAQRISGALQRLGVILFWRQGDRMTATRYRAGERGDDVSPALVLGGLDPAVEQLLLGSVEPDQLGEGIDPASVSRMQALRWLATGRGRS